MFFYLTIEHALNAEKGVFESHRHDRNVFITGLSRISYQLDASRNLVPFRFGQLVCFYQFVQDSVACQTNSVLCSFYFPLTSAFSAHVWSFAAQPRVKVKKIGKTSAECNVCANVQGVFQKCQKCWENSKHMPLIMMWDRIKQHLV